MTDKPYIHLITMEVKMWSEWVQDYPKTLIKDLAQVQWNGGTWEYV